MISLTNWGWWGANGNNSSTIRRVTLQSGIKPVLHGLKSLSSMNQGFKTDMTVAGEFTAIGGIQEDIA